MASLPASPPVVARYVASLADDLKISSIRRRVVAISQQHQERGFDSPTTHKLVREVVAGIARTHGSVQKQKSALSAELLAAALQTIDSQTLRGQRDRAILLLGFAGALRRSELAALDVADLAFDGRGLTVTIVRSKTDQEGAGRQIGIPYVKNAALCPVTALREWLRAAGILEGRCFGCLGFRAAAAIAKTAAGAADRWSGRRTHYPAGDELGPTRWRHCRP